MERDALASFNNYFLVARLLQVVAPERVAVLNRAQKDRQRRTKCRQPSRMLATPELKAEVGYRTELAANSFSRGCQRSSTRKITNICPRFPSASLLVTPEFRIRPAPPASHRIFGDTQDSAMIARGGKRAANLKSCLPRPCAPSEISERWSE